MTDNEETIAELNRQIWALDATVHNLHLQLEAVGAGGVQSLRADSAAREQNHVHIQRFNNFAGIMNPEARGLYVRYEDYAAHIAALTAPQQEVPRDMQKNSLPPQQDNDPDAWVRFWLHSALNCGFKWDPDQRDMAEEHLAAALAKPAPSIGADGGSADQSALAELERLRERVTRIGLDVDRAMSGHVNEQSLLGSKRLGAIAAMAAQKGGA